METEERMGTIREEAQTYEPPKTKNISQLEIVNLDELELFDGEGEDKHGNTFKYKYVIVDKEEYRVPGIVLSHIKEIIEHSPTTKVVKVVSKGEGKQTKYTVIPITSPPGVN